VSCHSFVTKKPKTDGTDGIAHKINSARTSETDGLNAESAATGGFDREITGSGSPGGVGPLCGAIGCHTGDDLRRVERAGTVRVLCPEHARDFLTRVVTG